MVKLKQVYIILTLFLSMNAIVNSTDEFSDLMNNEFMKNVSVYELSWMNKLFDHHLWSVDYLMNINEQCRKHLLKYISELNIGTTWASKSKYCNYTS